MHLPVYEPSGLPNFPTRDFRQYPPIGPPVRRFLGMFFVGFVFPVAAFWLGWNLLMLADPEKTVSGSVGLNKKPIKKVVWMKDGSEKIWRALGSNEPVRTPRPARWDLGNVYPYKENDPDDR